MADVTMPQLGETVTEGTITKWFKQVGDEVAEDEPLFEVSTDKVDSEVPAPRSGTLTEIRVPEGETVEVGEVLAVIGDAGEAPATAPSEDGQAAAASTPAEAPADAAPAEPAPPEPAPAPPAREAPPAAPAPAAGDRGPSPAPAPAPANGRPDGQARDNRLLSPVVRKLVAEHGLDPDQIQGTGVGGRITRSDVLAVVDAGGGAGARTAAPAAPTAPAPAAPAAPARPAPAAPSARRMPTPIARDGGRDTTIPHSNIRRRTAEHMVRSKQTSAHVYASIEVDYEGIDRVRAAERERWKAEEGFSLTYLPFVARAVVDAVHDHPEVNATFTEDAVVVHHYVNLAIAVDLDFKGLMAPVIRDAETKRLRAIAREVSDLAARARAKQLGPDQLMDGTFTITNPGPFGTLMTMPIINQPQVAILSTDGVTRRPVVVTMPDGSEGIAIHSVGNLALTWDHRSFDGAYAASFLRQVKEIIETRDWAAEL